ncbi:MAG: alpha amylase C-terminal domain-containing protein [Phycisphaerae bacterium]|nr:alpha amylase C-terminal domain-containing protein [Phycisphaerae bacterium]
MTTTEKPARSDGTGLTVLDPWLEPYADALRRRQQHCQMTLHRILEAGGSLDAFSRGHLYFGLNRGERGGQPGVWYREWAPGARALFLAGDFNDWNRQSHPLDRDEFGVWSLFLDDAEYAQRFTHGSRVKVHVHSAIGPQDHLPAYIRRAIYDSRSHDFCGQYWSPPQPYSWRNPVPRTKGSLRIYEAHVGMALEEPRVGTYREFADHILARIAGAGYNAVQLMAIQEHPYYGSFGYQVSNFFAPSSRFGTPDDLKALIDAAHGHGLLVFLDLVHSHAVKNIHEGLNHFDGTDHQYCHAGSRGQHVAWDSLVFDYGKLEVLRFLLSNVRFWLEEYRFDGFRFDGVTSMMYLNHGLDRHFASYDEYFPPHVDEDAVTYLQLANQLVHTLNPAAVTIAEDMSGMVGLARPVAEGGLGFDYRLAMGIPDYWIKLLKERCDERWQMDELYYMLTNRRHGEKHIAYAESHDQALVGDKTIAFRLMDADMYYHMIKGSQNVIVERGMALHKMIRLITFSLGGEGYLNFMGNEFGHPEWIDFPREGNNYSYKHARRQWSLTDDPLLRYRDLAEFDRALQRLDIDHDLLARPDWEMLQVHEDRKCLIYRRGRLVFAFNFHPNQSYTDYRFGLPDRVDYKLILNTDELWFGGHANLLKGEVYPCQDVPYDGRKQSVQVYMPARTALVLAPV